MFVRQYFIKIKTLISNFIREIGWNIFMVFVILLCLFIISPLVILNRQFQSASQSQKNVSLKQKPTVLLHPYRRYPVLGNATCATSHATGATRTHFFLVPHIIGNGKSDMYNAIQNTIIKAANAGGGIVKLPKGTFLINGHLVMRNNVALVGSGPQTVLKAGSKFLDPPSGTDYSIITTNGAENVTIADLTADQQGNVLNGNSVDRFFGYVVYVHNSTNVIVDGVYIRDPFSYSLVSEDSTKFCFKNNNTQVDTSGKYDQLDGIHILNSSYGDVLNNYVDQGYGADGDDGLVAHTIGGSVHDVTYAGNIVRGGKGGSGMQLALTNSTDSIYNIKIQNNEFWGSPRGIRTGYYGQTGGSVHDIIIGGSKDTGNVIHDNTFNDTAAGDAVNIYGNGIDPYNITVTFNSACRAGTFLVGSGIGNIVRNNANC